jgi:hypothetical protein
LLVAESKSDDETARAAKVTRGRASHTVTITRVTPKVTYSKEITISSDWFVPSDILETWKTADKTITRVTRLRYDLYTIAESPIWGVREVVHEYGEGKTQTFTLSWAMIESGYPVITAYEVVLSDGMRARTELQEWDITGALVRPPAPAWMPEMDEYGRVIHTEPADAPGGGPAESSPEQQARKLAAEVDAAYWSVASEANVKSVSGEVELPARDGWKPELGLRWSRAKGGSVSLNNPRITETELESRIATAADKAFVEAFAFGYSLTVRFATCHASIEEGGGAKRLVFVAVNADQSGFEKVVVVLKDGRVDHEEVTTQAGVMHVTPTVKTIDGVLRVTGADVTPPDGKRYTIVVTHKKTKSVTLVSKLKRGRDTFTLKFEPTLVK